MRVGLLDLDSKIPNLALLKLSAFHKAQGNTVILNDFTAGTVDKVYCSVVFDRNRAKAMQLRGMFSDIEFGGTGWDLKTELPTEIEASKPDYDLYTMSALWPRVNKGYGTKKSKVKKAQMLLDAGIGFTSRGCTNSCAWCRVPKKEGKLRKVGEIKDIVNPRSRYITLLDNNFTADPDVLDKLREIKERELIVDITQGIDIRTMTPEIAKALSEVKHSRSLHYAWDQAEAEPLIMRGIGILTKYVKAYRHLCFMLVGFNSTFEQDMYRFRKLCEIGIDPYVMVFDQKKDLRLNHFARFVNSRIHKVCDFEDYEPWRRDRARYSLELFPSAA